eukprot:2399153-Rhodomonas_salina.1
MRDKRGERRARERREENGERRERGERREEREAPRATDPSIQRLPPPSLVAAYPSSVPDTVYRARRPIGCSAVASIHRKTTSCLYESCLTPPFRYTFYCNRRLFCFDFEMCQKDFGGRGG